MAHEAVSQCAMGPIQKFRVGGYKWGYILAQ